MRCTMVVALEEGPEALIDVLERADLAEVVTEIRRQRVAWQREASMAFADGRAREALESYQAKGCTTQGVSVRRARAMCGLTQGC